MTHRLKLISSAAVGLFVTIAVSACGAQPGTGKASEQSAAPQAMTTAGATDSASMARMDHTNMPGMGHGAMADGVALSQSAATDTTPDHSNMAGMASGARPTSSAVAMDHGSMTGMDHSTMHAMDHASMAGTTSPSQSAPSAGATDHSTISGTVMSPAGMPQGATRDHSSMPGMAGMEGTSGMAGMRAPPPTGTVLAASSPASGAMVQGSPGTISLTLPQRMTLQSVSLSNAVGQRIPLSATLPDAPVDTFTTPAAPLPAGSYTVAWTAATGAQTVNGTFGFMVH